MLVLLAALLHAVWNALLKSNADRLSMMAFVAGGGSLLMLPLVAFVPYPSWDLWKVILLSLALHTGYKIFLVKAYTHGDMGQVYPLARGTAPAIVTLVGFLFLGEKLPLIATVGIIVILAGIVSLAWRSKNGARGASDPRAVFYALGTSGFIAAYTLNDGLGGRMAETASAYVIWLFVLDGISITAIALWRRGPALLRPRRDMLIGLGGGFISTVAYWIVIWAMSVTPLGPVAALRETSVVFGALISGLVLKEGLGLRAIVAACVVAAGVILLKL
ncbi:MAG: DMT family transporter [Parvibaculum sp.]|uniref:DMT family transporter n=1 Tax=Parvibaculum sp. TaxID=2024848 RepID=UPI0025FE97F0|nr:DMT family transporter [Parvibaculum sp.]MCE9650204.1 DMT family transporter [Parvibaculum sp.]